MAAAQDKAVVAKQPLLGSPTLFAREASADASSEEIPSLTDLRLSGDSSMDGSGGEGGVEGGPLRIWARGSTAALSRESHSTDVSFLVGEGDDLLSPSRSPESDTEPASPVGFWREKFETIDARNATRSFSGWGDNGSGEDSPPEGGGGTGAPGNSNRRPTRKDVDKSATSIVAGSGIGLGRKLFPPPQKQQQRLPKSAIKASTKTLSANLKPMAEGDQEFCPSPMGPPGGGPHPPPFWATPVEPARGGVINRVGGGEEKGGGGGLGWRRGEAGLVIPEPLPPKPRSVTIQQVVSQRAPRIGNVPSGGGDAKRPLSAPRPSTTSPTLPNMAGGDHKPTAPKEVRVLSPGVKIVRSYSYHGLGSMALYDANEGSKM